PRDWTARGAEDPDGLARAKSGVRVAVPARSARGQPAAPSKHRRAVQLRPARRQTVLPVDGIRRRRLALARVQAGGRARAEPRADLYAIGCIGYELLTGAPVFTGTPNEVLQAHVKKQPPPPSTVQPAAGIPPELDAVVLHCLAKKAPERFQTAADLYAALSR